MLLYPVHTKNKNSFQTISGFRFQILLSLSFLSLIGLNAQTYSLGMAGIYGDDIQTAGINTRAYINSNNHHFCIGPELTWFFKNQEVHGDEVEEKTLFEFNLNGHYVFEITEKFGFYGLTGLNYSREKERILYEDILEEEKIFNEFGMNLGGGLHYILNPTWIVFSEYDRLISNLPQNTFTVGLFYTFGKGFKMGGHDAESH